MRQTIVPSLLALCLSACGVSENRMNQPLPADSGLQPVVQDRGLAKLNPQPRRGVDVVLSIQGAPGPFAVIEANAQFDVVNEDECGHINTASGTAERITSQEPFVLQRVSDTEYRGRVYLDLMQDEDYYDRGVCRWELTAVYANLRATGAKDETLFRASLGIEQLRAGAPAEFYFWKGGYPRSSMDGYRDSGYPSPESFKPELRDELFKLTLQGTQP